MVRRLVFVILIVLSESIEGEVYLDRPKIKTLDGDLILEPAYDKNIYLRPNGPKSCIYVGELDILNSKSKSVVVNTLNVPNNDIQELLNGPSGILQRLEKLESRTLPLPDELFLNISTLWRRVNNLHRKINRLQSQNSNLRTDECQSEPCQHGGTCLDLVNGYHCLCPKNWEGHDCDIDVNECRNFAGTDLGCQNGATCINKPGYYECFCRSGWFGLHCTRKAKDCTGGDLEMCGYGTCLKIDSGDGITCMCHQGWTTNGTGVACLTDINECDSHQGGGCSVNPKVECINLPGSFRCGQCPPGYEGNGYTCADIDECATVLNGGCSLMVACHNTVGSRLCGPCPPGYQGDGVTCSWKGSCNINHGGCHPSAQCVENMSLGATAQCICPEGMEGDGVGLRGCYISSSNESESCANKPCGSHGQCHKLRSGYTCICFSGYGGSHCNVLTDLCSVNPCRNSGICRLDDSTTTGFRCECTAQYSGPLCQVLSKNCGGVLDAEEGSIVYPLSNTTYNHNSRCAWVIHTVPNKVINVTFSKFSLENGVDCSNDFLQIHDGRSSASQLLGRFCGNNFPMGGNIISSHNNIYLWFRSDPTVSKEGFALHWTSVEPVCGGEIDATTHGHISSPGSPGMYPPNRDCYWHLKTALDKKIQLHFFALDIENHINCSFDYLVIYDGMRQSDPLLSKYCNSTQPAPILSAGPEMLIHFHSDAYGSGNGFQIAYAPAPGVPGCGGYFTTDRGEITAPSFNGTYLNNVICEYKIKTGPDTKVRVDFKEFHLERSLRCRFDYLKVYDGPSEESPLVGKFCGTTYPKFYIATSNKLFIRFRSDITISGRGFKISYESICQQTFRGDSGVIKSPGYPFSYPENKVCEYIISTTPGKAIQLVFQDFDIEDNRYSDCQHVDNVEIRDGRDSNATLLGRYCGGFYHVPPVQMSTYNYLYIRFNSDMSISGTGFYANYTIFDTECGGIHRETTGLINHPSDDSSSYKDDQSCTWILIAPEGMHIMLTWHRFEIEYARSCDSDYLELIEIDIDNINNSIGKFCGSKIPPTLTTFTNRLKIGFKSDRSVKSSGFSVSYTFLDEKSHCGGNYFKSHGLINSPGWPRRYEANRDCTWIVTVPVGQQIRLNVSHFDLERPLWGSCNHGDYLEIRNGASQSSILIGKYCGSFRTKVITSLANTVYIRFHSDYYLSGNGFQLEWDGSVFGCGGTLTSSTGSISSPNYPDNYNENTECFYKIVTSLGSRIRISFTDLELERTKDCRDDYVEIYDGKTSEATSLGKHCYMYAGLNNIDTASNNAFIKFRTDSFVGGKGFLLNYYTVCNNNLTGRYGVIESPDYPNTYPMRLDCLWNINVPIGNRINVTFTHFDIWKLPVHIISYKKGLYNTRTKIIRQCNSDYLQWKETKETKYSDAFCGIALPPMITTTSNSLQIKFATGEHVSNTGFRLEWVNYGCGGHIQKRYGTLSIDSTISSKELECEWLIETPIGTSVFLIISDLYLIESPNCTADALEMYNGQNVNYPLLTRICNRHASSVTATANFMLVKLVKRSLLKGAYFTSSFSSPTSTCGGNIHALSGLIYSKNYPKNYDNNLDCTWIISVPINHRIQINIIDLDLYSNEIENTYGVTTDDCDDAIKIFDIDNEYSLDVNYTSIICPRSNLTQLTTNNSIVMLQFTSDGYGNAKGFKANFSVTCGATIIAINDGIISNEHYIGGSNVSCTWTIRAAQLYQKISLTITHIYLPKNKGISSNKTCWSSYLRVYDGDNIDAPLIDEYCGKHAPPMIVSRGNTLTILLGSYNKFIDGRFSAHYSSLNEMCGGVLYSEEGTIASPNYPRSYPVGADCEWTLNTSPGNKVYVFFEQFQLEYSEGCNEDYLEIRQDNGAGQLMGVYCGTEIPTNTTAASRLYVKFHSNDKNSATGFLFHYGYLHGNELINIESGEIASPLYPHLYQGIGTYTWRIESRGAEGVTINIDNFEIPSFGDICNNYLSIYDGYDDTAPLLSELCGKISQPVEILQTTSNMAYIKLSLDETNTGSQFHLSWTKKDRNPENIDDNDKINCGANYTELIKPGNFSIFTSPNFPENYDNDLNCEWTFEATKSRHLSLQFHKFALEETRQCFADYINIYSADTSGQWKLINESVCETETALQVTHSSKYMKIIFRSDPSITKKGFRGQVSSICGGSITDLSGEVGPIWDDAHIGDSMIFQVKCQWSIKVRPGRVINLHFTHFNISNRDDNCVSSVTLRNGDTVEAPFLAVGKYCGYSHETRTQMTTSSNSLHISYVNAISRYNGRTFQNFRIHYEEKGVECGTTSTLDVLDESWEVIQSPNYPLVPVPFSECIWTFTGPPGETLQIDFIDRFDLDNVDGCGTEFVEVRNGLSSLSPIIGRYCGENPGTVKTANNALYVRYLTQLSEPRVGFKANISIGMCGGTLIAEKGEIKSSGYPNTNFRLFSDTCKWRIRGEPRLVFTITPLDIDLPKSETPCATKVTIEENIPGKNVTAKLREFCDKNLDDRAIETSTNEFVVTLNTGKPSEWSQGSQSRGFRFSYNSSRPKCGGTVTTPEGYLTSPGYPLETVVKYCNWYIMIPDKTRRIRLEILDLNLNKHSIVMFNDKSHQAVIQLLSGPGNLSSTRVYESSGNKMSLFVWRSTVATRHRFKAKFNSYESALCGDELKGINGELSSPTLERSYTCEWHYNTKSASSKGIEYNSLLVTARVNASVLHNRCQYDEPKLNIKSPVSKQGLLFYRDLCGHTETQLRIPSSDIEFKATKGNNQSFYFHLEWKSQPCGGLVNVAENAINILNIPVDTNDTLDCAWMVTMPFNHRVELKMEGSFQYSCNDEYLKIGQGLSESSPTIGDYCKGQSMDNPLVVNFRNIYVQYHTKARNSTGLMLMVKTVKSQCGGQLSSHQYVFSSPNYPKSYDPNQECSWFITADLGSRISLRFIDRFVVEDRPNCTKDVVIIYDWKNEAYDKISSICGRQIPLPYNSTFNKMKVVLRTDATTNTDGFKAVWTSICGGNYLATEKKQMLYSPGFPFGYSAMENCTYKIFAPDGKKPIIEFIEFELEGNYPDCNFDNITIIGEDDSYYQSLYETYCGNRIPLVITNYNQIVIAFRSDQFVQKKGFKLSYQIYECGGHVKEPTLLSSHRGDSYDINMNCTWFIQAPINQLVVLKFWYIDLESHYDCDNDYVAVYDDLIIDYDKRLALMCGHVNSTTVLRSRGSNVLLQFVSDHIYNFKGFQVEVTFTYSESVGCGGHIELTTLAIKTFKSPLLNNSVVYENHLDCQWSITSPPDTVIKIEFIAFHISPCLNVNQTAIGFSTCDCDLVEIADGLNLNSFEIGTYCGDSLPPSLFSSQNAISVRLSTDGEITNSGFEAQISSQLPVCGQSHYSLGDEVTRIKSPGFERGLVPRGLHCVYYFDASHRAGSVVRLSILTLNIQPPHDQNGKKICKKDKLVIAYKPGSRNVSLGKDYVINHEADLFIYNNYNDYKVEASLPHKMEYCGSVESLDIFVTGSMTLALITSPELNSDFSYKGFDIEVGFSCFCGRNYTGTQGKIQLTYDAIHDEGVSNDCFTLITAPANHTISAYFISVSPDYWNDDIFLDIYNGNSTSSEKLASIRKDYETTIPIFSKGRYMLLHNHADESEHIAFDMNYVTTDKGSGCGGKLQNELGRVTSPLYPKIYRQKSSCEWELETPIGTRLHLHFDTFDLGRSCDQNYLQLVNSEDVVISSYCSEKPADYISTDNFVKIVFFTTMNNGGPGWVADFIGIV